MWSENARREWVEAHPSYQRDYAKKHYKRKAAYSKQWLKDHPERALKISRRAARKHRVRIRAYRLQWYKKNKPRIRKQNQAKYRACREALDRLKNRPCADCKKKFPPCAMDFHHVRGRKRFTIGQRLSGTLKKLVKEIEKCVLLCANCHRIRHNKKT